MQRLERLVVHIEEAMRLAGRDDEASQRLALLLFDSAAELMLHREVEHQLFYQQYDVRSLQALENLQAQKGELPPDLAADLANLKATVLSEKRRRNIAQYFDSKAAFVQENGLIPAVMMRVLRRLHQYRNEAYHRDEVRAATLRTAVKIYGYIVCVMLKDFPLYSLGYSGGSFDAPPSIAKYLGSGERVDFETKDKIAEHLLAEIAPDPLPEMAAALSAHALDRLDTAESHLEYAADFISEVREDVRWDIDTVLHLVQVEQGRRFAFASSSEIRAQDVKISLQDLKRFRKMAERIAAKSSLLAAFQAFAELEDAFEAVEQQIIDLVVGIDAAINAEVDRMRGK